MSALCFKSARELRDLVASKKASIEEVVRSHIERIEAVNPTLNAIVTNTFDQALERASTLQSRLDQAKDKPLFGLPVAHKDMVSTKGIRTTYGSLLHKDNVPDHDALIVTRMRAAGAITIGKTNTPEFGAGSHTFNKVFGVTRNPYDTTRTCGGSSGGAAVALASRMVPLADGSDFGGSLRNPAAFCNVIGFRPSPGRIPMNPSHNPWSDLATLGPMGRTVEDVALLFSVLSGPVQGTHGLLESLGSSFRSVSPIELKDLKIAFSEDFGGLPVETPVRTTLKKFAQDLESHGARVDEIAPDLRGASEIFQILRAQQYRRRHGLRTKRELAALKDTIRWNIARGAELKLEDVEHATEARQLLIERVASMFDTYDLIIGPVTQVMPFPVEIEWVKEIQGVPMHTYIDWMQACSWITLTAMPCLSLPAGFHDGVPVGAQLIAPHRQDGFLLSAAQAIESVTNYSERLPALQS